MEENLEQPLERLVKQYIIVRQKYPDGNGGLRKVRTGKLVSQGAHASLVAYKIGLNIIKKYENDEFHPCDVPLAKIIEPFLTWDAGKFTKITLYVESEEQLDELHRQAIEAGLLVSYVIRDAGLTEFNGEITKTALAIGPCWSEDAQHITGSLPLL